MCTDVPHPLSLSSPSLPPSSSLLDTKQISAQEGRDGEKERTKERGNEREGERERPFIKAAAN